MATLNRTERPVVATRTVRAEPQVQRADADVLQCLVVSPSERRRLLIRSAAEAQAWIPIVCRDAREFLQSVFKRRVPLIVVDLSRLESNEYRDLRGAAEEAVRVSDALLLVSGAGALSDEEVWARSLGVWSYLPDADSRDGFEHVLREAQNAISRKEQLQRGW